MKSKPIYYLNFIDRTGALTKCGLSDYDAAVKHACKLSFSHPNVTVTAHYASGEWEEQGIANNGKFFPSIY